MPSVVSARDGGVCLTIILEKSGSKQCTYNFIPHLRLQTLYFIFIFAIKLNFDNFFFLITDLFNSSSHIVAT